MPPPAFPSTSRKTWFATCPAPPGVIDLKTFLNALVKIGYDGPIRAEPFKAELRKMPAEQAVALTAKAMKQAFALVG